MVFVALWFVFVCDICVLLCVLFGVYVCLLVLYQYVVSCVCCVFVAFGVVCALVWCVCGCVICVVHMVCV